MPAASVRCAAECRGLRAHGGRDRHRSCRTRHRYAGNPAGSILPGYEALPDLAAALRAQGFQPPEIGKILGGNYARVFAAVVG
jgi:hypothetical protein